MIRVRALPAWQAYGLALAAGLVTALVAVPSVPWLGPAAWLLFTVPVALSAWVGGFGPGALATLISVLSLSYFFTPAIASLAGLTPAAVGPVAAAALALAFLTAWVARARQTALQSAAQASRAAALAQASVALANAAQPPAVLETFARELAGALPVGLVVQGLADDGETLQLAAIHHPQVEAQAALREAYAAPQKAADSIGSGTLSDGQAALLTSVSAEQLRTGLKPRFWPNLERFAGSQVLLVPLRSQGVVLGLASLLRPPSAGGFRDDEQAYVMALAERAAAALLAARRAQTEVQQRQAAEAAAQSARRLQGLAGALAGARTAEQVTAVQVDLALETGSPDESDRAGRDLLARESALMLERIRAEEAQALARAEAERAAARLSELQAATAALSQALTLEEVYDQVLRHGLALARAEAGALSQLRDGQPPVELVRSSGYTELALRGLRSLRLDQPAAEARAAASGEPVWVASREACVSSFPEFAQVYASLRCESLAVLPLAADGVVLGTLTLAFQEQRPLPAPEHDMLLAYAAQCGQALRRAARHDRERLARAAAEAARDHAVYLTEVGDTLAATLNLPATLQSIAKLSLSHLADFSLVFALGNDGLALGWSHAHHNPERDALLASSIRLLLTLPGQQRSAIQELVRAGRLLHVPDLTDSMLAGLPDENGLRRNVLQLAPRALLVVPLLSDGRPLGVLLLCAATPGHFTAERQALAQALAQRAARAVEHALRHAVAQSLNVELEERVNERTEELQATIAKLEDENTQRERTQAQLEISRQQLRSLSARLQAAREEERSRIAREVHDELGQQLAGIKMDIAWMRKKLREQQEPLLRKAKAMADLIDTTVQSVRKITQELRPGILDDFGLLAAIEWQLQEFQTRHNLETHLTSDMDEPQLDPESATAVFRVFQETLTNVARHAQATRVEVTLENINDQLILQVEDNGRGITDRELYGAASLGLLGMRERIHLLAGEIDIRGVPGEGTTVLVRIPLARTAPAILPNGSDTAPGPHTN
jgi:signal transduction histidine kinase